jgi:hypothetical protein
MGSIFVLILFIEKDMRQSKTRNQLPNSGVQPERSWIFILGLLRGSKPDGATPDDDFGSGISDMLALNARELIAIERGGAVVADKFFPHVRLFHVAIDEATTDVSAVESLQGVSMIPAKKELLLDLDSVIPQLSTGWQSLDNIEGITFGPTLENGHKTLLLISDDNFNSTQRTQAIALEIVE